MLENGLERVLVRDTDEFERLRWQLVNDFRFRPADSFQKKKKFFCPDWLLAFRQIFDKIRPDSSQGSHHYPLPYIAVRSHQ